MPHGRLGRDGALNEGQCLEVILGRGGGDGAGHFVAVGRQIPVFGPLVGIGPERHRLVEQRHQRIVATLARRPSLAKAEEGERPGIEERLQLSRDSLGRGRGLLGYQ